MKRQVGSFPQLGPATREINVKGRISPGAPELSFDRTVEDYKREYRQRYQEFLRTGTIRP